MSDTKENKVIEMYKKLNLEEKLHMFELICMNDVSIYMHSDKKDIGFSVERDDRRFHDKDEGFWPTLNGCIIQFNIDLGQATAACSHNIDIWGGWNTTLESFLKPSTKKKTKKKLKQESN